MMKNGDQENILNLLEESQKSAYNLPCRCLSVMTYEQPALYSSLVWFPGWGS